MSIAYFSFFIEVVLENNHIKIHLTIGNSFGRNLFFRADLGKSVAINAVGVVDAKVDHRIFFGSGKVGHKIFMHYHFPYFH